MKSILILLFTICTSSLQAQYLGDLIYSIEDASETIPMTIEDLTFYTMDFPDCYDEEGSTEEEMKRFLKKSLKNFEREYKGMFKLLEDVRKENGKVIKFNAKYSPYFTMRISEIDSLTMVIDQFINEITDSLRTTKVSHLSYINDNVCNDEAEEFIPFLSLGDFYETSQALVYQLYEREDGEYELLYDEAFLMKVMKKNKVIRVIEDNSYDDSMITKFISFDEESGKMGVIGATDKDAYVLIPASFDSVKYQDYNEIGIGWSDGYARFFHMDYGNVESPMNDIESDYDIPYEDIAFVPDYSDLMYLYYAKQAGLWGLVDSRSNKVVSPFTHVNIEEIDISSFEGEEY